MSTVGTFIEEDGFGFIPRPDSKEENEPYEIIRRYTMTNKHGSSVQLISWGAGIQSIKVPNKYGILGDVVLGFDDMDGYLKNRYVGSIIGRVVNRSTSGRMRISNDIRSLMINDENRGNNNCNCGFIGIDNVNWESRVLNKQVVMSHLSRANNEECSGNMLTQIKFSWTEDNQLHINISATATVPVSANITNYCLLNLAGHATGANEFKKHVVSVNADSWNFADIKENLPTGVIYPVEGTFYDLRFPTQVTKNKLRHVPGGGYNHNFCITSPSCWCYRFHARILHPGSGRTLELYSNQPCLQFYTGNDLPDPDLIYPPDLEDYICNNDNEDTSSHFSEGFNVNEMRIIGKDGVEYRRHGGFALMPQNFLDYVDTHDFPSCILYPGKVYVHDMSYKFGVLSES